MFKVYGCRLWDLDPLLDLFFLRRKVAKQLLLRLALELLNALLEATKLALPKSLLKPAFGERCRISGVRVLVEGPSKIQGFRF